MNLVLHFPKSLFPSMVKLYFESQISIAVSDKFQACKTHRLTGSCSHTFLEPDSLIKAAGEEAAIKLN